jgi:hypothetical protein
MPPRRRPALAANRPTAALPDPSTVAKAVLPVFIARAWAGATVSGTIASAKVERLRTPMKRIRRLPGSRALDARIGAESMQCSEQPMRKFQAAGIGSCKRIASQANIDWQ